MGSTSMKRIGLTGGIGSGKSTVASFLAEHGCHVIDADAISRNLTCPSGAAMPAIVAAFGAQAATADGALNRPLMREWISQDGVARQRLEHILHPLITQRVRETMLQLQRMPAPALVLDIALLAESGPRWRALVDLVWVIDCRPETQVERVVARSAWPVAQIEGVMAAQASRSDRLKSADWVLVNDAISFAQLKSQVDQALLENGLGLRPLQAMI